MTLCRRSGTRPSVGASGLTRPMLQRRVSESKRGADQPASAGSASGCSKLTGSAGSGHKGAKRASNSAGSLPVGLR